MSLRSGALARHSTSLVDSVNDDCLLEILSSLSRKDAIHFLSCCSVLRNLQKENSDAVYAILNLVKTKKGHTFAVAVQRSIEAAAAGSEVLPPSNTVDYTQFMFLRES